MDVEIPMPVIFPERCDGCGLCVKACPTGALAIDEGMAVVHYSDRCDYSLWCEMICPRGAISLPFEIVMAEDNGQQEGTG